ncbi:MAG: tRNA (N(6)-L-threonylcarbamoyladenosine(37)-C(2))-methylthiotransferase MtaB [Proteobacteria bacterium]|nr:tRNA (N(6)-L-threonylcarbamoyladenosine(37)-C(2))-methylthiotransferase MtaB [Pseudomonadota bacterium]
MKKVLITTLGCKVNQYESASFKAGFEDAGLTVVARNGRADIVVINTCAVTGSAGAQSRQAIHKALRKNPGAEIIICGCYAEIAADDLAGDKELQDRTYTLIGNSQKGKLVSQALAGSTGSQQVLLGDIARAKEICRLPVRRFADRVRAYLRIQDGCESFCTYCIVPYTRGPSRSLPVPEVLDQAKVFAAHGHKEIVLTGIHLGNYGKDLLDSPTLITLLDTLSLATPEVAYRISSLEPLEIDTTLLTLMQGRKNIQPHLHIPLQSGHDEILTRMNRRYSTEQFREIITLCRKYLPDAAIGIDILVGFPGETDAQFADSQTFLQSLDFSYLHVFPYSIRPGTKAAGFDKQVSKAVKDQRVASLRQLSDLKKTAFCQSQLGRTWPVLVEGRRDENGMLKGFTTNYIAVTFLGPDELRHGVVPIKLLELQGNSVFGEINEI